MWKQGGYNQVSPGYGNGCCGQVSPSYDYCKSNQVSPAYNVKRHHKCDNTFVLIVVLFILLIIVGATFIREEN